MCKQIENYDFVFGSRYQANAGSEDDTIITKIGNFIFTKMNQWTTRIQFQKEDYFRNYRIEFHIRNWHINELQDLMSKLYR